MQEQRLAADGEQAVFHLATQPIASSHLVLETSGACDTRNSSIRPERDEAEEQQYDHAWSCDAPWAGAGPTSLRASGHAES
jgi:hypothetical protein